MKNWLFGSLSLLLLLGGGCARNTTPQANPVVANSTAVTTPPASTTEVKNPTPVVATPSLTPSSTSSSTTKVTAPSSTAKAVEVKVKPEVVYKGYSGSNKFILELWHGKSGIEGPFGTIEGRFIYANKKTLEVSGTLSDGLYNLRVPGTVGINSKSFAIEYQKQGLYKGSMQNFYGTGEAPVTLYEVENNLKEHQMYGGYYILQLGPGDTSNSQYLNILFFDHNELLLDGYAMWQGNDPDNIHFGTIGGVLKFDGHIATYRNEEDGCQVELEFTGKTIVARESAIGGSESEFPCGGNNVTFNGTYVKISPRINSWNNEVFDLYQ